MKSLARLKRAATQVLFKQEPRHYIPLGLSPQQFFSRLNDSGCRYVVVGWFDGFPQTTGGDIDLLVHDDDIDSIRSFLRPATVMTEIMGRYPHSRKCDVYSISGLPGSSYKGFPYHPPPLAAMLLERAELHPSGAMVPCKEDRFLGLAYHALYHKGLVSGIPTSHRNLVSNPIPKHDYTSRLKQLADELHIKVAIEMEALDAWLNTRGWRPPVDMIEKHSGRDAWWRSLVEDALSREVSKAGLAAFIVRERALDQPGSIQRICGLLEDEGFNILAVKTLSAEERDRVAEQVRGGNWGRGPSAASGGRPAVVLAAVDVFPKEPDQQLSADHPGADNARVFIAKTRVRNWWNEQRHEAERCSILHSADNCRHASLYIRLAMPELNEVVLQEADRLISQGRASGEVVRQFPTNSKRAIVELIRRNDGGLAVRKTFRPGREVYLARELQALEGMRKICPDVVPAVLERGSNYFVMPFYKDIRRKIFGRYELPLPIYAVRKAFAAVKIFFDSGYIHMDFRPKHVIVQDAGEIKLIDFESVVDFRSTAVFRKHDFCDVALGKIKDWPMIPPVKRPVSQAIDYKRSWDYAASLPLQSILRDPLWLLYVKRWTVGYPMAAIKLLLTKISHKLSAVGSESKGLRVIRSIMRL